MPGAERFLFSRRGVLFSLVVAGCSSVQERGDLRERVLPLEILHEGKYLRRMMESSEREGVAGIPYTYQELYQFPPPYSLFADGRTFETDEAFFEYFRLRGLRVFAPDGLACVSVYDRTDLGNANEPYITDIELVKGQVARPTAVHTLYLGKPFGTSHEVPWVYATWEKGKGIVNRFSTSRKLITPGGTEGRVPPLMHAPFTDFMQSANEVVSKF